MCRYLSRVDPSILARSIASSHMTGRRLNLLISLAILAFFKPLFKTAKNLHKFPSRSETVLGLSQSCYQRHVPRTGYSKSVVTRVVFLKMSRAAIKGRHISCLLSEMKYGKSASFVDYCLFVHPIINRLLSFCPSYHKCPQCRRHWSQKYWEKWLNVGSNPRVVSILWEGCNLLF